LTAITCRDIRRDHVRASPAQPADNEDDADDVIQAWWSNRGCPLCKRDPFDGDAQATGHTTTRTPTSLIANLPSARNGPPPVSLDILAPPRGHTTGGEPHENTISENKSGEHVHGDHPSSQTPIVLTPVSESSYACSDFCNDFCEPSGTDRSGSGAPSDDESSSIEMLSV